MFEDMETVNKIEKFRDESNNLDEFLNKVKESKLAVTTVTHSLEVLGYHTLENYYNMKGGQV